MATEETQAKPPQPTGEGANWTLRIVLLLVGLALIGVAYFVGTTLMPRWWAQRVGNRVDGRIGAGTSYGLFIGFVFVFVPLLVARQALRRVSWKLRLACLVAALLIAMPNLMTLAIVMGNGNGAHAGDRILDIEGPGFRVGTAWGAVVAAVLALAMFVSVWKWRRDRRKLKTLKNEQKAVAQEKAKKADGEIE